MRWHSWCGDPRQRTSLCESTGSSRERLSGTWSPPLPLGPDPVLGVLLGSRGELATIQMDEVVVEIYHKALVRPAEPRSPHSPADHLLIEDTAGRRPPDHDRSHPWRVEACRQDSIVAEHLDLTVSKCL